MAPKVVILMADYGNDPTETAIPFTVWKNAGYEITFATEKGASPRCDKKMLEGLTQKLLGAERKAIEKYDAMLKDPSVEKPVAWTDPSFSLSDYDLIFLPGGHDKGVQQIITSKELHAHLAEFIPKTVKDSPDKKACVAVCHGVQVLAAADNSDGRGKSVIHDFETTSLLNFQETFIFQATRLFLGDYYKTFGAGTDNVEDVVRKRLDNPKQQFKCSMAMSPWIHEDPKYNYISGRFPPDAELLATKSIEMMKRIMN